MAVVSDMVVEDVERKDLDKGTTVRKTTLEEDDDNDIAILSNSLSSQDKAYDNDPKSSFFSSDGSEDGYEEMGPVSIAALPSEERKAGVNASRIDPVTGELIKVKWRRKKRKGLRHQRLTPSVQDDVVEEESEGFDDRMGDAEDRVLDIEMILETGKDVDTTDLSYVSNYQKTKGEKKKKKFIHSITCGIFQKKEKVIGY